MKRFGLVLLTAVLLVAGGCAKKQTQTVAQGNQPTQSPEISMTDVTPLQDVMANPSEYVDKTILVQGEVTGRCMGSGCWISLKVGDDPRGIIVTTTDESWIFPTDCVGKSAMVEGTLRLKNADEMEMQEEEAKGADHECPNPEYFFEPKAVKVAA